MTTFATSAAASLEVTTFDAGLIESFYSQASDAMALLDGAYENAAAVRQREITRIMDSMSLRRNVPMAEFLKGNARTNPARADIKAFFEACTLDGLLGDLTPATARCYAGAYWVCFEAGIEFSPSAANDKSKEKAAGKVKAPAGKKVDVESYGKALAKCLAMARLLQRNDDASALLDMIVEIDPEFVEAE